ERAQLRVRGVGSHRGEEGVRLEVCGVGIAVEREEVVPHPDAVDLECVGGAPRVPHLVDGRRLGMELHPDLEAPLHVHSLALCGPGYPARAPPPLLLVSKFDPAAAVAQYEGGFAGKEPAQRRAHELVAPAGTESARFTLKE